MAFLNNVTPMRTKWESQLIRAGKDGPLKKLMANVVIILTNALEWKGCIGWDAFAERVTIFQDCPAGAPGLFEDVNLGATTKWLQTSRWRLEVGPKMVAEAMRTVAATNTIHPLQDRLNSFVWDGKARLDTWTSVYLGAEDTPVHREMGLRWMLSAVLRAFVPGSKADVALILEGPQGLRKSTALRILGLGWFSDQISPINGTKAPSEDLPGVWIMEFSELDAMSRAQVSATKDFIVRCSDRYRSSYGHYVGSHPRQCVFAGSTNDATYLRDPSGARRFSPIACGVINIELLKADVEQLWAEALQRWRNGERTYTSDVSMLDAIKSHTLSRYEFDVWHERVANYAKTFAPVSADEVINHLGIPVDRRTPHDASRVVKILRVLGYTLTRPREGDHRPRRWEPPVTTEKKGSGPDSSCRDSYTKPLDPLDPLLSNIENESCDYTYGGPPEGVQADPACEHTGIRRSKVGDCGHCYDLIGDEDTHES